jgi:hypothetical protein
MRGFFTVATTDRARLPTFLVGGDPAGAAGPWDLAVGHRPEAPDEIVLAEHAASRAGLDLGDRVVVLGTPLEVVGLAGDADLFMASFAFVTHEATDRLLGAPGSTSFVLVETDEDPGNLAATAAALRGAGMHVRTPAQLMAADLALKSGAYDAALGLLVGVAALVCVLVVALTIYGGVVAQARSFGVLKAIGAGRVRLYRIVLAQSLLMAAGGVLLGAVLFGIGRRVLGELRPEVAVHLTGGAAVRAVAMAAIIGLLAAWLPARRLTALAPAGAFGGRR